MVFYGREDILSILDKRVTAFSKGYRQNIAIIADELAGKTSTLKHWLSSYCDSYVVCVYIDDNYSKISDFTEKFAGTMLFSFLKNSQSSIKEDLKVLIQKSRNYIPNTCALIERLISDKKKNPQEKLAKLLSLPESLYKETSKRCLIIIDEFNKLEKLRIKETYELFGRQIMLNKNSMYVITSSNSHYAGTILSKDLNLLFGNFERLDMGPLSGIDSSAFIQKELTPLTLESRISEFIIYFSCSNPFYLNTILTALKDSLYKKQNIKPGISDLITALEDIFTGGCGVLNKRFLQLVNTAISKINSPAARMVLLEIAKGANTLLRISKSLNKPKKEILKILQPLQEINLISKNSDIYSLKDRLFGFWLKCVYPKRTNTFDPCGGKEDFKISLQNLFSEFICAQDKAVYERVIELFNDFSNESVELHKKRLRLRHFSEIKLINTSGRNIKKGIIARTAGSLWITGLKEDKVSEEDMRDFVRICKSFKYNKSQKRIFIAFDDIEDTANLIAKEEKIYTWNTETLNTLMDIYSKPRIVI